MARKVGGVIVVLSGGVGAARLLRSLRPVVDPDDVTAVINVGDDTVMHGLVVCPDIDTVTYTLAGESNDELGWGRRDESWRVMDELAALGGSTWFRLGDRDLGLHLYRTGRMVDGATKSEVTEEVARRLGIRERLRPVSDDPVSTRVLTAEGWLDFQDYFVRHRHEVPVSDVFFSGAESARPAPGVLEAIAGAERIVIAPSNPIVSIGPLLAVPGIRDAVRARRDDVVAVSPLIGGSALKGPADRMMRELGHESSCVGIARCYQDVAGVLVIDEVDRDRAIEVEDAGLSVRVTTTVMADPDQARRLAEAVLA